MLSALWAYCRPHATVDERFYGSLVKPNAASRLLECRDFAFPIYVLPSWKMLVKTPIPLLVICDKPMLKLARYLHRHSNFRRANTRNLTDYGSFIQILRAKETLTSASFIVTDMRETFLMLAL